MECLVPGAKTWNGYSAADLRRFANELLEQWQGRLKASSLGERAL
jgi:hypothetical protein